MSAGSNSAGEGSYQSAIDAFKNVELPSIADQQLSLATPDYSGDLQNQLEAAIGLGPSAMEGVAVDPRLAQAQMSALNQLSQTGQMGMTPAQAAALADAQRTAAAQAQAKSAQLQDEFARRGMGGSGAEFAARLAASQSGADMANQNSNAIMQMAQQNALNALTQSGSLAGQMSGQQFQQQSDIAKAKDYINQFNAANQQNVQQRNVGASNAANQRNLDARQQMLNQAANTSNQQQMYNKGLLQQNFQNQMARAGGLAGQYQGMGNIQSRNQQATDQANAQMMGNTIGGIATIGAAAMSDERTKKNIHHFDAQAFLDKLQPSEYEYKNPEHGPGKQVGVMAQDVEKEVPQMVHENEDGLKYIDYNKAGGPIFASLADLHERLKQLEGKKNV